MKQLISQRPARMSAFTLVEMLVVIAVIGILAALLFPSFNAITANSARKKARNELEQIQAAIDRYHAQYSHYPPDNALAAYAVTDPRRYGFPQLFYELLGTTNTGPDFVTLDGRSRLQANQLPTLFGASVSGFINCSRPGGDDATSGSGKNFLPGLLPAYYGTNNSGVYVLKTSAAWPKDRSPYFPTAGYPSELSPFFYNSSSPKHNPKTYDLWVDIVVRGKTNRISNWNPTYETVYMNY